MARKFEDRIVVTCTSAFRERFERARKVEAQKHTDVPNEAETCRKLIGDWVDGVLAPHRVAVQAEAKP